MQTPYFFTNIELYYYHILGGVDVICLCRLRNLICVGILMFTIPLYTLSAEETTDNITMYIPSSVVIRVEEGNLKEDTNNMEYRVTVHGNIGVAESVEIYPTSSSGELLYQDISIWTYEDIDKTSIGILDVSNNTHGQIVFNVVIN